MTPAQVLEREQAKAKREALELALLMQLRAHGLAAGITREHQFDPTRRWRFDFAWLGQQPPLAVEVEGGVYSGGRHTRGDGFTEDCSKYNRAACMGWCVLRVTAAQIKSGEAIEWIRQLVQKEGADATCVD